MIFPIWVWKTICGISSAKGCVSNRVPESGQAAANLIQDGGGEAIYIKTDVSQKNQVEAMIQEVLKTFGRLDYAFNNAGSGAEEIGWHRWRKRIGIGPSLVT